MRDLLLALARALVSRPDQVSVRAHEEEGVVRLDLHVAPDDRGRVIGRHGRTAQALRTLVGFVARRHGLRAELEIV